MQAMSLHLAKRQASMEAKPWLWNDSAEIKKMEASLSEGELEQLVGVDGVNSKFTDT